MMKAVFALPLLTLAACAAAVVVPTPPAEEDACGASAHAAWIGQDASVIDTARFANPVRVYHQGDALTMDFSPSRINFELGADDTILRIYCG